MGLRVNITAKLLGYLLLAGIVPVLVLGFFSWEAAHRVVLEQAESESTHLTGSFASYLALYDDQIEDLATNIAGNEAIGSALRSADAATGSSYDLLNVRAQIGYTLNAYSRVKGLVSLDLFSVGGRHFHVGETLGTVTVSSTVSDALVQQARSMPDTPIWRGVGPNINTESRYANVRTVVRAIRHFSPQVGSTDFVGLLVISLADDIMHEFLRRTPLRTGQQLMLVDGNGLIAMHSDSRLVGNALSPALAALLRDGQVTRSLKLDGEAVLMDSAYVDRGASHIIILTPRSLVIEGVDQLTLMTLGMVVLCLAGVAALTWRYGRTVVQPIRAVATGFRLLHDHPDTEPAPLQVPVARDEIAQLVEGFNDHLQVLRSQKSASSDLESARRAAEAASRAKSDFLANMSHEIRTPMNAILGMLQLMRGTALDEKQKDYVSKTERAAKSLLGLLNDILDFSKVEAGKMVLDPRPFAVQKLLDDLAVVLSANMLGKGIEVRFDLDPAVPSYVLGDDLRIMQVLVNLGGNAIKFTTQGEVVVRVIAQRADVDKAKLEFSVVDTGIGISPEQQAHIFDSFSQAESNTTRRFGGSGLGLTISRRLVELMGGELLVESVLGKGSRFFFVLELPLAQGSEVKVDGTTQACAADRPAGKRLSGMHVLLVEDNKINQMVAENLLSREGALVTVADNGQLALEALGDDGAVFHVVLMDLQMPVMDGMEATQAIRQQPVFAHLPIIAMTANAMATDREACLRAGMNDHIGKPFELDHLVAVLLHHVTGVVQAAPALVEADSAHDMTSAQGEGASVEAVSSVRQLDVAAALDRMGGNAMLLGRAVESFIEEAAAMPQRLQILWSQGEVVEIGRVLHTLKGLSGTIGAVGLASAMGRWEKQAKAGLSQEKFAPWLYELQSTLNAGLAALTAAHVALGTPVRPVPSQGVGGATDRAQMLAQLALLESLLKNSDLQAMDVMQEFQSGPGAMLGEDTQALAKAVQELDFGLALEACQALRSKMAVTAEV